MANVTLKASVRTETGKGAARKIRQAGNIPAVIYGHGRESQALTTNARDFDRLARGTAISSTVIELHIDGRVSRTLIREIQRHPFKRSVLHIDFQELVAGETVVVNCPIVYIGTPEGVRSEGGILDQIMHELSIEVDPADIPGHINADISDLRIGKALRVSDLTLPAGVTVLDDPEATVAIVSPPRVADEATSAGETAEPELIRKVKPDDTV